MALMNNIGILLEDLRRNKWHITAFQFDYKDKNYIVLFEDITNLQLIANRYLALLTFIDKADETRILQVKANTYCFEIDAKKFREYFGIEYVQKLGDVFKQFYERFGKAIKKSHLTEFNEQTKQLLVKRLSYNDKDNANAICCYKVIRNGIYDGKQRHRTPFNRDKTKLLRPELYNLFKADDTLSFCYRETAPLSDKEICLQFAKSYGYKKL